ncbi:hypothetical protein [Pyrobaculum sp.]|uniref:hypothetical protein n=1 Tax=Pyrobaculum sp. TaxID=2004705 RepID=UPI003D140FE0
MWRTVAIAVVAAAALAGLVYLINLAAPSAIKYADSYDKVLVLEVSASNVLFADRVSATLRNLKNGSLVYRVECTRHSIYGGFRYARFLCNASAVEPGIYAIEISWPLHLEGTVVVR